MEFRLIKVKNPEKQHVSMHDVDDFESSLIEMSDFEICYESRYLRRLIRPPVAWLINNLCPKFKAPCFCISMGASGVSRSFPYMFFSKGNILYLFDAWPDTFDLIRQIVRSYNIKILFISSKDSAERLQALIPGISVIWCPEGIRDKSYKASDYQMKDIDILQLGRKYDLWHERVVHKLYESGITYLYEKVKGEVIFKSRDEFIDGLGRSKISVCFPKSLTHSNLSGGITTMTNRYLQSILSRCLILGEIPDEMKELFGYDPGVKVDMNDPAGQVVDILKNFPNYIPLIEKNYNECLRNHSWQSRWLRILDNSISQQSWRREV